MPTFSISLGWHPAKFAAIQVAAYIGDTNLWG